MKLEWPNQFIKSNNSKQFDIFLQSHHLEGLAHQTHIMADNQEWKKQWIHNEIKISELKRLSPKLKQRKISPVLLKGMDLLNRIYTDYGSRFLSDIDLLLTVEELTQLTEILLSDGYEVLQEKKWFGNLNKKTFGKSTCHTQIVIECHTHLFYHLQDDYRQIEPSYIDGYLQLSLNYLFVHLCGHLAFQHNFLKAYWLLDLYYIMEKYHDQLDWQQISDLSKVLKLKQSVLQVLWIMKKYFNYSLTTEMQSTFNLRKKHLWKLIINRELLLSGKQGGWRYFILKHLTKDSIVASLKYDILWIVSFFSKK